MKSLSVSPHGRHPAFRMGPGRALGFLLCLVAAGTLQAQNAEQPVPDPNDRVQINETVTNGFVHPGIGLTKGILENARRQIIARRDPWYAGYLALASNPASAKAVPCRNEDPKRPGRPEVDAFDSKSVEGRLKQDCARAMRQALMYFFTGDEAYRANAMHILRVWSQMDPKKYKVYNEAHIHSSYAVKEMILAAELMRYTSTDRPDLVWTERDTREFSENFAIPAANTFLNENGWFMNQNGYPLAAAMAKDIFTNDRAEYEKRVEWFTVNRQAPNKGWSSSIQDLARKVEVNALTGEKVAEPVVQLMEMGRDQAHAGGDVEIFQNTARQMNAQGTKVDPVTGEVSTADDAVGPYEFLDDRILAAANHFCRFMLGYDTPWVPSPSDIGPDGVIRQIYPWIADNYRGRIRGFDFWDMWYYYTVVKGVDVAKKAPYYHEAFTKRIVASDTDWIYLPESISGEGARVAPSEQQPAVVEVEQRSTVLDEKARVAKEGEITFLRISPSAEGTRVAILSADTDKKVLALRVRSSGDAEIRMSGIASPLLIPDTGGEWRNLRFQIGNLERFRDIVFLRVHGSPEATVEIDSMVREGAENLPAAEFRSGPGDLFVTAFPGAPIKLDLGPAEGGAASVRSLDKPEGSELNPETGAFFWKPAQPGEYAFVVSLAREGSVSGKRIRVSVAADRSAAVDKAASAFHPSTPYSAASSRAFQRALDDVKALWWWTSNEVFFDRLTKLHRAAASLEPLPPQLADGSMDYPRIVKTSDIGESIGLLVDGNDDTFPVFTLAKDFNYIFDFGPGSEVSVEAFAMEGRLNFESRTQDTAMFGSRDGKNWIRLTEPLNVAPAELSRVEVAPEHRGKKFRFLKFEKTSRASAGLFEPAELRIFGTRSEGG